MARTISTISKREAIDYLKSVHLDGRLPSRDFDPYYSLIDKNFRYYYNQATCEIMAGQWTIEEACKADKDGGRMPDRYNGIDPDYPKYDRYLLKCIGVAWNIIKPGDPVGKMHGIYRNLQFKKNGQMYYYGKEIIKLSGEVFAFHGAPPDLNNHLSFVEQLQNNSGLCAINRYYYLWPEQKKKFEAEEKKQEREREKQREKEKKAEAIRKKQPASRNTSRSSRAHSSRRTSSSRSNSSGKNVSSAKISGSTKAIIGLLILVGIILASNSSGGIGDLGASIVQIFILLAIGYAIKAGLQNKLGGKTAAGIGGGIITLFSFAGTFAPLVRIVCVIAMIAMIATAK